MSIFTDRLALPLLSAGQAQKEVTHNEALALADILLQPVVQSVAPISVPSSPVIGQCWIVGIGPSGAWAGKDGAIACWTSGGWRFAAAIEGMQAWSVADAVIARRIAGNWIIGVQTAKSLNINGQQIAGPQQAAISAASGGSVIDTQARASISAILGALRAHGLIST
jgi:hypothetical protein